MAVSKIQLTRIIENLDAQLNAALDDRLDRLLTPLNTAILALVPRLALAGDRFAPLTENRASLADIQTDINSLVASQLDAPIKRRVQAYAEFETLAAQTFQQLEFQGTISAPQRQTFATLKANALAGFVALTAAFRSR